MLNNLLNKIRNNNHSAVLVIGDLILDKYIFGDITRISPEAPVPIVNTNCVKYMPGGAANVANNLNALNIKTVLLGVVGDSRIDDLLLPMKNITVHATSEHDRQTTQKTRIIAQNQQIIRIDEESTKEISAGIEKNIHKQMLFFAEDKDIHIDAIIISDYCKGVITKSILNSVLTIFPDTWLIIDSKNKDFYLSNRRKNTVITPNLIEAENIIGTKINGLDKLHQVCRLICYETNCESVLLTMGKAGMFFYTEPIHLNKPYYFHIPAHRAKEVYDVSGAGDTAVAVFTAAIISHESFNSKSIISHAAYDQAARLANIAAGTVVTKMGVVPVSLTELAAGEQM